MVPCFFAPPRPRDATILIGCLSPGLSSFVDTRAGRAGASGGADGSILERLVHLEWPDGLRRRADSRTRGRYRPARLERPRHTRSRWRRARGKRCAWFSEDSGRVEWGRTAAAIEFRILDTTPETRSRDGRMPSDGARVSEPSLSLCSRAISTPGRHFGQGKTGPVRGLAHRTWTSDHPWL